MPELPEVETTRRGIAPSVVGKRVSRVVVREPRLRWPVTPELAQTLPGQRIEAIDRRGKYLLARTAVGTLILHLGMSGSLRIVPAGAPATVHEHVDIEFGDIALRLRDPRRFGAMLWTQAPAEEHPLLAHLGPEPLGPAFGGAHLHALARGRRTAVKNFIMDGRVVVGVGNIYASEALFLAGIRPGRQAGRLSRPACDTLAGCIRRILNDALTVGGTTLRDFVNGTGEPGYFYYNLRVYDRTGQPCRQCGTRVRERRIGQRSSFYCPTCQR